MATENNSNTLIAVAAMGMASLVGMGTAMIYTKRSLQAAEDEHKRELRREKRRNRELRCQTAEY